jgi:outer membrane lipoprotein-sorting protein
MKRSILLSLSLLSFSLASVVSGAAQAAPEMEDRSKGLSIAKEAKLRDFGWKDSTANMQMMLRNKQGKTSVRKIRIKSMEMIDDGDKSLTVFDQPRDVKGTAFLSFSHAVDADEQWLYLPALKRVKRISSATKSGPFMGSEFAFEDLASFEVDKYSYQFIKEEKVNGMDSHLVKYTPNYKNSGYKYQLVWLDKQELRAHKIEFYDRKGSLLKTLTANDYQRYLDTYWRPALMTMVNHQTGKSTDLRWKNYQFQVGLAEKDFSKSGLKRAR